MAIKTNYGSVTDWLSNKEFTPVVTPNDIKNSRTAELQGLEAGDLYGIEYDAGAIEGIYNRATDAQYALKQKEYQAAENQYYRNMYASQNSAIDALRAQRADQIATGMSAGLAAAAESATAMGLQDTNAAGALELANQRQMMADEIAAAYAENIVKAFETSQSAKQAIAGLDLDKFKADTEWDLGAIAAYTMMNETAGTVHAAQLGEYSSAVQGLLQAQSGYDIALENARGQIEAATLAANAEIEKAKIAANAEIESAKIYNPTTPTVDPNLLTSDEHLEQFMDPTTGAIDYTRYMVDLMNNGLDLEKAQEAVNLLKQDELASLGLGLENIDNWIDALDGDKTMQKYLGIDPTLILNESYSNKQLELVMNNVREAALKNPNKFLNMTKKDLLKEIKKEVYGPFEHGSGL